MSGFNLLHLITNAKPVTLKPCGLPSGTCRTKKTWPKSFSQEELKKRLSPIQFHVTQERGTESAFRGEYTEYKEDGIYTCVVCGAPLFKSETKFDSGSGWPSFYDLVKEESVTVTDDFAYGMHRVETSCSQCGSHLGHLFDDGPRPTGKRYCINSASLGFQSASASGSTPPSTGDGTGAGTGPGGAVGAGAGPGGAVGAGAGPGGAVGAGTGPGGAVGAGAGTGPGGAVGAGAGAGPGGAVGAGAGPGEAVGAGGGAGPGGAVGEGGGAGPGGAVGAGGGAGPGGAVGGKTEL